VAEISFGVLTAERQLAYRRKMSFAGNRLDRSSR